MTDIARVEPPAPVVNVDTDTLKYLGYDPNNIATKALVLVALRYELDPLLGEIRLIRDQNGAQVYVTRDGMLTVAHRSGQLDGIVVDEQRRNSTADGYTAYVSVYRKDMAHPFKYGAQCKDSEPQAKRGNGPEMALARAERRALKRAFRIRTDFYPERPDFNIDIDADPYQEEELSPPPPGLPSSASEPVSEPPGTPTPPSEAPSGETPLPIDVTETEFIVPTRDQITELTAHLKTHGLFGKANGAERREQFTEILGRTVDDERELSRADYERLLAEYRTAAGSNQGGPR